MTIGWRLVVVAFCHAAPVYAGTLGQGGGTEVSLWRVAGALLLCCMLALGGALALRHRMRGTDLVTPGARRRLKLIEKLRLGQQAELVLVRCDGQDYLVALSPKGAELTPVPACGATDAGSA